MAQGAPVGSKSEADQVSLLSSQNGTFRANFSEKFPKAGLESTDLYFTKHLANILLHIFLTSLNSTSLVK